MDRIIRCDCGFEVAGTTDDELATAAQAHSRQAHGMELAAEVVRGLARADEAPAAKEGGLA
jgi:predicted small metal-binding protein